MSAVLEPRCIHELLSRRCKLAPKADALHFKDQSITYAELDARADAVASALLARGVGPEVFIGLAMERSIDAAIGIIGILKAGGAYVYLDPAYPVRRLTRMIDDCNPALVLDRVSGTESAASAAAPAVTPDNAAYLIYTSGSTGIPKAAIEIHRSLTARLASEPLPDIQPEDVCGLTSSLSFGISASRLFLPLVTGARVVILPDEQVKDVGLFVRALDQYAITSIFMVPAQLRQVLGLNKNTLERLQHIRAVTISGGALTPELVDGYFRAFPKSLLVNNYGSSEIGTSGAIKVYTKETGADRITIGRPAANTIIRILDGGMSPVSPGEIGEIYVIAPHLARGYLNRPDLTAERFLFDEEGRRIYRTGDLGRYLPDGEIEFLGRQDQQVKIRGYRIELGEVEAVLEGHPEVTEAAVIAVSSAGGDQQLRAYLSVQSNSKPNPMRFREFLLSRLPDHMIPSYFFELAELPHTDAGKIDRTVLTSLQIESSPAVPGLETLDAVECSLAQMWLDVLGIKDVCGDNNFVELGGDSLQATQVIHRIETTYGFRMQLVSLFDETLAQLARRISSDLAKPEPGRDRSQESTSLSDVPQDT